MHLHNIHSRSHLARRSFWLRLEGGKLINMVNPGEFFLFFSGTNHILSSCLAASIIFGAAKSIDGPAESPASSNQTVSHRESPVR